MFIRALSSLFHTRAVRLIFALCCAALPCVWLWLTAAQAQQACATRPLGMIAWFRAEGNGLDSIGTHHATLKNNVGFTTGKVAQAFEFNGTNEVVVPEAPDLSPARITIEGWVYPTLLDGSVDTILNKDSEPFDGYHYEIGVRGSDDAGGAIPVGNFAFALRGVNGLPDDFRAWVNGGGAVPLNTWTHVAVTYDGSTARTYLNGAPARTLTGLSGDILPSGGPVKIASRSDNVLAVVPRDRFNGRIDEISLYNRALSADEILAIFNAGSAGKCPLNTPPTITAGASLSRPQGGPGAAATLATVSDMETVAGNLTVAATTLPTGITVSSITNTNGTITGTVAAGCNAALGANTVVLTVNDGTGTTATANLIVNVTANPAPTVGPYPSASVNTGQSTTVTPSAAPADNNTVASVTAAISAGFTGTVAVNATTGVVTLTNAGPAGAYVVTVTVTDNCGATLNSPFNLTVGKLNSTTQLAASAGPYLIGQPITLTASITATGAGAPTGTVNFLDGTTVLGTGTINSAGLVVLTTSNLSAGTHKLTAVYAGDANYGQSTSNELSLLIARAVANVSAASFRGDQFAQEQVVAAFGTNLAPAIQSAATLPLPTTLAGTSVRVKDSAGVERLAGLFFVSASQINYLLPAGISLGPATVSISNSNTPDVLAIATLQIATVAPGAFSANANGTGPAAAVALRVPPAGPQTFEAVARLDQATNRFVTLPLEFGPPAEQLYLILFGTGLRFRSSLDNVKATVGGVSLPINFAGPQGSLAGLDQVNILLSPALTARGEVDVVLMVDGVTANTVRINFR